MEQFEQAMMKEGVPLATIQLVKDSPIWRERIRNYTPREMDLFIDFFPKIYITVNIPSSFYSTPAEFERARKQYVPMDLSD